MKNIHTLQELNLDAARYRWVREHTPELINGAQDFNSADEFDGFVDWMIEHGEEIRAQLEAEND